MYLRIVYGKKFVLQTVLVFELSTHVCNWNFMVMWSYMVNIICNPWNILTVNCKGYLPIQSVKHTLSKADAVDSRTCLQRPWGHNNLTSQERWSFMTNPITFNCRTFCQEYLVFQDRWSLMAVGSHERFNCSMVSTDLVPHWSNP